MPIKTIVLLILVCAVTAIVAAPRLDVVCVAEKAIHLNDKNYARWSCMHYAAARGATSVIKRMLDYGADVDQRNAAGRTPLAEAAKRGRLQAVALLLSRSADVNAYGTQSGFTPLHLAAQYNHPAVVRQLLSAGANVNARNQWNQTPLWQAAWQAWHDNTEVAHILVAHGAQIDVADEKGYTPLQMAARAGNVPMVSYLLAQGADVNHANNKGRTPLYQAVVGNNLQAAKLLLKHGADPNTQAGDWTPLRVALEDGHLDMADLLHSAGAKGYERYAADARLDKGYRLLQQKNVSGAIEVFNTAISLRPKNPRGYYYRGLAFHQDGNNQKAVINLRRAVELDPDNSDALEWLGAVYTELGEYKKAADPLHSLLKLRPDYGRGYYLLAQSLRGQSESVGAQSGLTKACALGYQPACGP